MVEDDKIASLFRENAARARDVAANLNDAIAKQVMFKIAEGYEHLAARAESQMVATVSEVTYDATRVARSNPVRRV
jgi:hypothetical protein